MRATDTVTVPATALKKSSTSKLVGRTSSPSWKYSVPVAPPELDGFGGGGLAQRQYRAQCGDRCSQPAPRCLHHDCTPACTGATSAPVAAYTYLS
ncbi:MAG: hypothetical protein WDO12_09395 [Pseudomonadota bacterium]